MYTKFNPTYKDNVALQRFVADLPTSFAGEGTMLWDKRNKIKSFSVDGNTIVVKKFRHPNSFRKLIYLVTKNKARKAFDNGLEMIKRGIDTPEPISCVEIYHCLFIHDCYYVCRELKPSLEIRRAFDKKVWDKEVALALARFFAEMHQRGILHHDMNNTNVLFSKFNKDIRFQLIDVNRVSFFNSITDIPLRERIENMTRFSSNSELMEYIFREYAKACGINDVEGFVLAAMRQKKHHDMSYHRSKAILHPLRKR